MTVPPTSSTCGGHARAAGAERLALDGESTVSALAFAGDTLLVGRWDGTVAVVNASVPGAPVRAVLTVPAPAAVPPACSAPAVTADGKVRALAVDASGRWLAAGTNNCLVAVWDLQALAQPPQVLTGHAGKVRTLAFVPGTYDPAVLGRRPLHPALGRRGRHRPVHGARRVGRRAAHHHPVRGAGWPVGDHGGARSPRPAVDVRRDDADARPAGVLGPQPDGPVGGLHHAPHLRLAEH